MSRFVKVASVIALLASPVLIHIALFHSTSHVLPLAFLIIQLGGLGLAVLTQVKSRIRWPLAVFIAAGIGLAAWMFGTKGVAVSSGLSHTVIHSALAILFGASLREGREPLVTGIMQKVRGPLPPELVRYGQQVTILWCGSSLAQLLVSFGLLIAAPLSTWSFFINVLSLPLVLLLFTGEVLFHTIRFRHLPRSRLTDLFKVLAAWRKLGPIQKAATN